MRIGIDISQAVYEGTGSGRYVIELLRNLLAQDTKNRYVLFGSAMRRKNDLQELVQTFQGNGRFEYKLFPFPPRFYEVLWNKLRSVRIEQFIGDVDIFHSSDWTQPPSKSKRITTVHDLIPFLFPEHVHPRIRKAHERRWKWIKSEIDHIIVDAEHTKNDIVKLFSIPPEKISVIPLGCDKKFFEIGAKNISGESLGNESDAIYKKYGVESKRYLLSVGTLEPRKNIRRLIEAHSKLSAAFRKKYPLLVVGKKAWDSEFTSNQNVHFTGYVPDEELPFLYGGAVCFVMPSFYEGFGFPVLEAMASATSVVSSNSSSLPEIGGADIHYIEDSHDVDSIRMSIEHVLNSSIEERLNEAKRAYSRAQNFTWEKTARDTMAVYDTVGSL
jgi:glycosyltransferase involved in cell wall biosynthesis